MTSVILSSAGSIFFAVNILMIKSTCYHYFGLLKGTKTIGFTSILIFIYFFFPFFFVFFLFLYLTISCTGIYFICLQIYYLLELFAHRESTELGIEKLKIINSLLTCWANIKD